MPTQSTTGSEDENQTKLVFVGRVLLARNTIYYIRNISSVQVSKKSQTLTKKLPKWYWIFLGIGLATIPININVFPLPMALFIFLMCDYIINRVQIIEKYGITIEMNSGSISMFFVGEKKFIDEAIIKLYEILNEKESKPLIFDFSRNIINDNSIEVEQAIGTALNSGNVSGNINTQSN
jgi:hypothetical protein